MHHAGQGSPETQNQQSHVGCVDISTHILECDGLRELVPAVMEAGKSKTCRVGQEAGDPGKK